MAWTAASIIPTIGSVVTPAAARQSRNPSGGAATPTGASSRPAFLDNPSGALGNAMFPYAELLQRILSPQSAPAIPPELAQAYANQANANTARLEMQNRAAAATAALPGQIMGARAREQVMLPWSLSGLPTGLGYRDPLSAFQDDTFALRARQFGSPALSPLNSGWLSPGFY